MAGPGISTKNTEKTTPRPEIEYPENTRIITKIGFFGILRVCFGIFGVFWGCFLGVLNFGRGVFFRYFTWKFLVRPFRVSLAGGAFLRFAKTSQAILSHSKGDKTLFSHIILDNK